MAAGQSADAWIPKVAALSGEAARGVDDLRAIAATADARASLMEAAATITDLGQVDRRDRRLYEERPGRDGRRRRVSPRRGQTVAQAANQVDAARALEQQGLDVAERESRRRQLYALGAAAAVGALTLLLLGAAPASHPRVEVAREERLNPPRCPRPTRSCRPRSRTRAASLGADHEGRADICTDLGRVNERPTSRSFSAGPQI